MTLFGDEIIVAQLRILVSYLAIGFLAGLLVRCVSRLVQHLRQRGPLSPIKCALQTLVGVWLIHAWVIVRALVHHPHVMNESYYAQGGLWRWIHVFVSTRFSLQAVDAIAWAAFAVVGSLVALAAWRLIRESKLSTAMLAGGGVAAIALAFGVFAWLQPVRQPARFAQNNLIFLAVDSLRADLLTTEDDALRLPHLSQLAEQSVLFENMWTVMPRTFPSWMSMLTGSYPHTHGVRHMMPSPQIMRRSYESLFSVLKEKGYRTAVISDFAGDIFSRVDLGFETVRVPRFTALSAVLLGCYKLHHHLVPYLMEVTGGVSTMPEFKSWEEMTDPFVLNDEIRHWLSKNDGRPFALLVFYSTGHFPFAAPYPFYKAAAESGYEGPSRFYKDTWRSETGAPDKDEQEQIRRLYQGALRASDSAIGALLSELREQSLLETTHLIVTADHGEHLYEQTYGLGHGEHLFGSQSLKVPFLFRPAGPPQAGRRISNHVRTIDIAPTLLEQLKLPPLKNVDGVSLLPLAQGQGRANDPPVFVESGLWFMNPEAEILENRIIRFMQGFSGYLPDPETHEIYLDPRLDDDFLVAKHRAVIYEGYKLVYVPTRQGVQWQLYDLRKDPLEERSLTATHLKKSRELKSLLKGWMLSDPRMMEAGQYVIPRLMQ
jgi:arylsulfatase A-like enzyme